MTRYMRGTTMLVLVIAACQTLPSMTRTGGIKDVLIEDGRSTATYLQADVGDEIRWTNKRTAPVRITFLDRISDQLSCRHNFEGYFTGGADAILKPDQSASLCFGDPGTIPFIVRIYSALTCGEISRSGQVQIEAASGHPALLEESAP